ncbi:class I SAM-dependent methyltransferase [Millisia brevis]|uniref:class I SAM-dependent methyltransferase n=1 Tax=Millisia brevis TaxID=264148 RepID=UPI00083623EF|nr:class I SAM-dependent methyltransferase [Millisia brevis]
MEKRVSAAYGRRAAEYLDHFGSITATAEADRMLVGSWAAGMPGRIIDVGCGPGQWTDWLRRGGADIEGVDPTPEFVDAARRRFPGTSFRAARAEDLGVPDGGVAGILAWYSLIHVEPARIGVPLAEFARCLRPGGGLAIGFFTGTRLEAFDHAVTTAWFWPVDRLAAAVEAAGFTVTETRTRTDPGARPHAALLATHTIVESYPR